MFVSVVTTVVLLCTGVSILSGNVGAQAIDFSQIDSFESMGTGVLPAIANVPRCNILTL